MACRKPERRSPSEWREFFETAARMRRRGWSVHSKCNVCDVTLRLPLGVVVALHGESFSLWNRRPPCLVEDCTGMRYYEARPPGVWSWVRLSAPD
jgi:hypothetical protein